MHSFHLFPNNQVHDKVHNKVHRQGVRRDEELGGVNDWEGRTYRRDERLGGTNDREGQTVRRDERSRGTHNQVPWQMFQNSKIEQKEGVFNLRSKVSSQPYCLTRLACGILTVQKGYQLG